MTEVRIEQLINTALKELSELKLCDGSIKSYRYKAFQPILEFYGQNDEKFYSFAIKHPMKALLITTALAEWLQEGCIRQKLI